MSKDNTKDGLITQSFTRFLRKVSKLKCPIETCGEEFPDTEDRIKSHLQTCHPDLLASNDISVLIQQIRKGTRGAESKELAFAL